jgi:hypothetical protein
MANGLIECTYWRLGPLVLIRVAGWHWSLHWRMRELIAFDARPQRRNFMLGGRRD